MTSFDLFERSATTGDRGDGGGHAEVAVAQDCEVVENDFFAPAPTDAIESLLSEYRGLRQRIAQVADFQRGPAGTVLRYFLEGNADRHRGQLGMQLACEQLFQEDGAVAALDARFWSKALALTDVYDYMPQARRTAWQEQIDARTCPAFEGDTVRATLLDLLAKRAQFFGERVDGIFRGLSGEHVTNKPEGFSVRMIVASVLTYYDTIDHDRAGLINDLRCVIARFMGRDEPTHASTHPLLSALRRNWGEWVSVDGGALRIKLFKKGTAHLEVHPDMAWRLNQVLASLYPLAIPPEFRAKPRRRAKHVPVIQRPLHFKVLDVLAGFRQAYRLVEDGWRQGRVEIKNTLSPPPEMRKLANELVREVETILVSLGGVKDSSGYWCFPYPPHEVLQAVIVSGCLPDTETHQFYETNAKLAAMCEELAAIGDKDEVLEPSAGQGGLARFLPQDRTTCVELSDLRVAVLKAKGFQAIQADFLTWAESCPKRYDRIVMNPPYADGRALAHLRAAAGVLAATGRIVAILPASLHGRELLMGFDHDWSSIYGNEFVGTGVRVAILVARRSTSGGA